MLLMMGLSGALSLCICWSPYIHGMASLGIVVNVFVLGWAMGSPVSPVVANLYMEKLRAEP